MQCINLQCCLTLGPYRDSKKQNGRLWKHTDFPNSVGRLTNTSFPSTKAHTACFWCTLKLGTPIRLAAYAIGSSIRSVSKACASAMTEMSGNDTLQRFHHMDCDVTKVDGFDPPMLPGPIFLLNGSWNGNRDWVRGYPCMCS